LYPTRIGICEMILTKAEIEVAGTFEVTLDSGNDTFSINSTGTIVNIGLVGNTSYNLSGKVSSVGDISIAYNLAGRVSSIGNMPISYNLAGKISSICGISVSYNLAGRVSSIGNISISYNLAGKIILIGNNPFTYNLAGKISSGNRVSVFNGVAFYLKGV